MATKVIGTGGDYTTVQAWENALPATLTEIEIGEMKAEAFDENVVIQDSVPAVDKYIWLRAQSGAEFAHTTRAGARIVSTGKTITQEKMHLKVQYTRFGGSTGASSGAVGIKFGTTGGGANCGVKLRFAGDTLINCIIVYESDSTTGNVYGYLDDATSTANAIQNSIAFNLDTSGAVMDAAGFFLDGGTGLTCTNCVAYDIAATGSADDALGFHIAIVRNCYAGGCSGVDLSLAFNANGAGSNYNCSSDASAPGANSLTNKAAANQFVDLTGGSENFHLKVGADCIDTGNDGYSNEFDIDGAFAGTRNDIGADEYVAAGAARRIFVT